MVMPNQIIFSGPMIQAILHGRKTETRRTVKPQPPEDTSRVTLDWLRTGSNSYVQHYGFDDDNTRYLSPYGGPGELLRVRETWAVASTYDALPPSEIPRCEVSYAATDDITGLKERSPIHMPTWMSRISLRVTAVRVERLQDISELDAVMEGMDFGYPTRDSMLRRLADARTPQLSDPASPVSEYRQLWNSLNAKRGFPWEGDPWVWVVQFEQVD